MVITNFYPVIYALLQIMFTKVFSLTNLCLGQTYFSTQSMEEAEKWYKKSLQSKPDHMPAMLTYGTLLSTLVRVTDFLSGLMLIYF